MRHFDQLSEPETRRLFEHVPPDLDPAGDRTDLAMALGATLYSPGIRPNLVRDVERVRARGGTSQVLCLEDAISDADVEAAEANVVGTLRTLAATGAPRPLLFIRVRVPEQIPRLVGQLGGDVSVLSGFVLPKFTADSGSLFLDALSGAEESCGHRLFAMPVLESPEIIHRETRADSLTAVSILLEKHRDRVLAVRIGATDLSSTFGVRRSRDVTVYDVRVVADVIADIVNIFGRIGEGHQTVTGPVWEYFDSGERRFKPQLRSTPFFEHSAEDLRDALLARGLDGLLRETELDIANGLVGKSVIHPAHVAAVNAMHVVTYEEYEDACRVLDLASSGAGALASQFRNKMNEPKPHRHWAERTIQRARAFGVSHVETSFVDLLEACVMADVSA